MLTTVTGIAAALILLVIVELLRRRQLREKYAALWLVVGLLVVPVALLPKVFDQIALKLGIASGVSLVLFLAAMFLLLISVHLSWEMSRLEEETRTLAEELALLRTDMNDMIRAKAAVNDQQ